MNLVSAVAQLSRENLDELTVDIARPGRAARPAVRVVQLNGRELVIKDYGTDGSLFKRLLGRYLVAREKAAYQRLEGLRGVPRYYGALDSYTLVLQRIQARPAPALCAEQLSDDFFVALSNLVRSLHRCGIAHGDLERSANILVDQEGQPALVDFAASIMTGSNPVAVMLFPVLCHSDRRGVYKLKQRVAPHSLTADEARLLSQRSLIERVFRRCREPVRNLIRRWAASP